VWAGAHALARRERLCLTERCRAAQDDYTPLHGAALEGYAAVVDQLLAAGADTETQNKVRGQWGGAYQMRI